ncbi:hypothetical protein FACS1894141_6140 [Spirochaetia bacterium]|nr:hypothetical protein FACS1894141_6140 [Spirochaetia bacterium]
MPSFASLCGKNRLLPACLLTLFVLGAALPAAAETWYLSNAAGMPLEAAFSRLALRNKYALSVETMKARDLPPILERYYDASYMIELHILYENGEESRRQWIFRDDRGRSRLVAAFNATPSDSTDSDGVKADEEAEVDLSGFIELYNADGFITGDHQIDADGTDHVTMYTYRDQLLITAETSRHSPASGGADERIEALTTDQYRYSRSGSLRAVDRTYHAALAEDEYSVRHQFPRLVLGSAVVDNFVNPGSAYGSEFLEDVLITSGFTVRYVTDERGRILTETRRGEDGTLLGEISNTWIGDRLASVHWKAGEDDRLTEYEYDAEGDRILERNYNRGVLERVVRREGDREMEELYMNGTLILKALWENGRKLSEERVRSQAAE